MADDLDAVFGTPETEEPAPVEIVEPVVEAETPPEPEPTPEPRQEQPEERHVPLGTFLDMRDRLKAAEDRARQLEQQRPKADIPDPFDNPVEYAEHMRREVQSEVQRARMDMSWAMAVQHHGQDAADAAKAWALEKGQKDPGFAQMLDVEFQRQPMPIDWLVQQHKRDALLADIGDPGKLDDWFQREAQKRGYVMQSDAAVAPAAVVPAPASAPARVPRSLASQGTAPSDVRQTATGPLAGVDALF
jgi:hypothetical protein